MTATTTIDFSAVRRVTSRDGRLELVGPVVRNPSDPDAPYSFLARVSEDARLSGEARIEIDGACSSGVPGSCRAVFLVDLTVESVSELPAPPRVVAVEGHDGGSAVSTIIPPGFDFAWMTTDFSSPETRYVSSLGGTDEELQPRGVAPPRSFRDYGAPPQGNYAVVAVGEFGGRRAVTYASTVVAPPVALSVTRDSEPVVGPLVLTPATRASLLATASGGVVDDGEYSIEWSFRVASEVKADGTGPNIEFLAEATGTLTIVATDDFENSVTSTVEIVVSDASHSLSVVVSGEAGRVVSDVGGIACSAGPSASTCLATFPEVTEVTLRAETAGDVEAVWGSSCGHVTGATATLDVQGHVVCNVELRSTTTQPIDLTIIGPTTPVIPGSSVSLTVDGDMTQMFREAVIVEWFDREALGLTGPSIIVTPPATTDYTARAVSVASGAVLGEGTIRVVVAVTTDIPLFLELPSGLPDASTRWTLAPRYFNEMGQQRLFHLDYPDASCRWTVSFNGAPPQEISLSPCVPLSFGPASSGPAHVASQSGTYEVSIEATIPANPEHGELSARSVAPFAFLL
ncbi:hypothetical protein L6R52_10340 [Myxococcota bacterium]|nr:hypothetical protein [Myxococcota bacterium]